MAYIEGFVAAVPRANKDAYRKHAAEGGALLQEARRHTHGRELGR